MIPTIGIAYTFQGIFGYGTPTPGTAIVQILDREVDVWVHLLLHQSVIRIIKEEKLRVWEPRHLCARLGNVRHPLMSIFYLVHRWFAFALVGPNEQRWAQTALITNVERIETEVLCHDAQGSSACLHRGSQPGERRWIVPLDT